MSVIFNSQKRPCLSAALILLMVIVSVIDASYAASYIINPEHTNVRFALEGFKSSATTGGFYNVKGQLQYDPSLKTGDIFLTIPISSLNTGNQTFNSKLTGPEFFDAQSFPLAQFKSTNWYFNKEVTSSKVVRVDGKLTLHGETHPISLKASQFDCYLNANSKEEVCGGNFTATIDRTKWNIDKYAWFGLAKNLNLNIQVEATRQ